MGRARAVSAWLAELDLDQRAARSARFAPAIRRFAKSSEAEAYLVTRR
jgi:hypothetical protein